MTTEWVYLVNDRSSEWGYDVSVLEFMAGARDPGMHAWTLSRRYNDFRAGDYIWVWATRPISAIVGLGEVVDPPEYTNDGYYVFPVLFDDARCRALAADPIHGALEKHTQVPRRLTSTERRRIHRRAGALPVKPPVSPGRVRRLQEVVARQGQTEFRNRLVEAYRGRCAVTGCDVVEVLQAAHIDPYSRAPSNLVANGLLLRADIHDLFDRGLLWITDGMKIAVTTRLRLSEYGRFHGRALKLPALPQFRPDPARLRRHRIQIALQPK